MHIDSTHPLLQSAFENSTVLKNVDLSTLTSFFDIEKLRRALAHATGPYRRDMARYEVANYSGSNSVFGTKPWYAALLGDLDVAHQWMQNIFETQRATLTGELDGHISHASTEFRLVSAVAAWFVQKSAECKAVCPEHTAAAPDTVVHEFTNDEDFWTQVKAGLIPLDSLPGASAFPLAGSIKHGMILVDYCNNDNPSIPPPHERECGDVAAMGIGTPGLPSLSTAEVLVQDHGQQK